MKKDKKSLSGGLVALISFLMVAVIVVSGLYVTGGWNWFLIILSMIIFIITIGIHINGRPWGIFIDERNKMTLSRFQLVLWTLIVLSAFVTIALERVRASVDDPLAIELPWQLWALMGISTTSLVGSPLIRSGKSQKTPSDNAVLKAAKSFKTAPDTIYKTSAGILDVNENTEEAEFSDMFKGDETANSGFIDMAKVQMFFFTVIAAISYIVLLVNWIATKTPVDLTAFPELKDGMVAILGISHAGYLANKAVDHTQTQ